MPQKVFFFLFPCFLLKNTLKGVRFFYWTKQNKDVECCFKIVFIQMFNWKWFYFQKEKSRVQLILFHSKGFFFRIKRACWQKKKRGRGRERERGKRTSAVNKHSVAATRQLFTLFIEDSSETKKCCGSISTQSLASAFENSVRESDLSFTHHWKTGFFLSH